VEAGAEVLIVAAPGHSLPPALEGIELPVRAVVKRPAVDEHHGGLWWVALKSPFSSPEVQVHADQLRPGDGTCPECGREPGVHRIDCKLARRDREVASGKEPAAHFYTNAMLASLTHHTVGKNGGGLSVDHDEVKGRWHVGAEYGREAPDSAMAGAATYGQGSTLREALMVAGADCGLWINDGSLGPTERQRRILIVEATHPAEMNINAVQGSMMLLADADEAYVFHGDKAMALKHRDFDVREDAFQVAVAIQRRTPEASGADVLKQIRDLAPHEVSCNCGHSGDFDMTVHDTGCPRWQLAHVLAVVEAK
jgi:hypothetical protein